ncbi:MAG: HAMP domain-containing protein [Leptospirales bacterium]|nr:HAMP domain-containing protein [Leptospirales bacterium]
MRLSFGLKIGFFAAILAITTTGIGLGYFYEVTRKNVWNELANRLADIGRTGQFLFTEEHRLAIDRLNVASEKSSVRNNATLILDTGKSRSTIPAGRVKELEASADFKMLIQALRQVKNASRNGLTGLGQLGQAPWPAEDPPRVRYTYLLVPIPEIPDRTILKFIADADYEVQDLNGNGQTDPDEVASEIGRLYNVSDQAGLIKAFDGQVQTSEQYYEDQWGRWMSAYIPILRADGTVAAVMGIDMSATSQFNLLQQLQYLAIFVVAASFLLAILLSTLIARWLARPVVKLRAGAERVKQRDYSTRIDVRTRDELGILASTFNEMVQEVEGHARTLEDRVNARTAELAESKNQLSDILGNISEGILTLDEAGRINSEFSGKVPEMLGLKPGGMQFVDLFPDPSIKASVSELIEQMLRNPFMAARMFEDLNPLRDLKYLDPSKQTVRILSFSFSRIKDASGKVVKLLVVISDRTERIQLEAALQEREKEQSAKIEKLYQILHLDPRVFTGFLEEAETIVQRVGSRIKDLTSGPESNRALVESSFRDLHTLKGNARALNLESIAARAHQLEDLFDRLRNETVSDAVRQDVASRTESLRQEIADGGSMFDKIVNMRDVLRVKTLDASAELEERSKHIVEQEALAQGKSADVVFSNQAGVLKNEALAPIRNMLGHLLRNAVFHGIETPDERRAQGKTLDGKVKVSFVRDGSQFRLTVEDDGAGLDHVKIGNAAVARGMLDASSLQAMSPGEIIRLIFRSGFSTAGQVTDSAGRGVGLDFVDQTARSLGGSVRIETKKGSYSRFILLLPPGLLDE